MQFLSPENANLPAEIKRAVEEVFGRLDKDDLRILRFVYDYNIARRSNGMPNGCDPILALDIEDPLGNPYRRTERLIKLGVLADFGFGSPPSYVRPTQVGLAIAREIIGAVPGETIVSRRSAQHSILTRIFVAVRLPLSELKNWNERSQAQIMQDSGLIAREGAYYTLTEAGKEVLKVWERAQAGD